MLVKFAVSVILSCMCLGYSFEFAHRGCTIQAGRAAEADATKRLPCCGADPVTCRVNFPLLPLLPAVLLSLTPQLCRTSTPKYPFVAFGP